jgi:predicted transcriptional regulator of viral defense system
MTTEQRLPRTPFTPTEASRQGVPGSTLRRMADSGHVERIAHGHYAVTEEVDYDIELATARVRAPEATICLTSALVRHGLVDAIPSTTDLALPRGRWRPVGQASLRWHTFDARTFDIGRSMTAIPGTREQIGLYSAERSLVDAFRLRSLVGYEVAVEALREWLSRRGSSPADLVDVATRLPRARTPITQALSFLA